MSRFPNQPRISNNVTAHRRWVMPDCRLLAGVLGGGVLLASLTPHVVAQTENPAGDAAATGESGLEGPSTTEGQTEGQAAASAGGAGEEVVETWDSYAAAAALSSAARDVTQGVRVEDIVEPPTEYRFAAFGKSDPFVPPFYQEETPIAVVDPIEIPIISPLQRFPLSSLAVVGIWADGLGVRKALIIAPEQSGPAGIVAKVDDPIGINGGRILAIAPESLTVREFRLSPDGTRKFDDQRMILQPHMMNGTTPVGGTIVIRPGAASGEIRDAAGNQAVAPAAAGTNLNSQLPTMPAAVDQIIGGQQNQIPARTAVAVGQDLIRAGAGAQGLNPTQAILPMGAPMVPGAAPIVPGAAPIVPGAAPGDTSAIMTPAGAAMSGAQPAAGGGAIQPGAPQVPPPVGGTPSAPAANNGGTTPQVMGTSANGATTPTFGP